MQANPIRAAIERGEVQIGTWVNLVRSPAVLPLLKAAGLDFARVDMEHSSPSIETIADMAVVARALNFPIAVRPPVANREWITRLLDIGVFNLHCPQVESAAHAGDLRVSARLQKSVPPPHPAVVAPVGVKGEVSVFHDPRVIKDRASSEVPGPDKLRSHLPGDGRIQCHRCARNGRECGEEPVLRRGAFLRELFAVRAQAHAVAFGPAKLGLALCDHHERPTGKRDKEGRQEPRIRRGKETRDLATLPKVFYGETTEPYSWSNVVKTFVLPPESI